MWRKGKDMEREEQEVEEKEGEEKRGVERECKFLPDLPCFLVDKRQADEERQVTGAETCIVAAQNMNYLFDFTKV